MFSTLTLHLYKAYLFLHTQFKFRCLPHQVRYSIVLACSVSKHWAALLLLSLTLLFSCSVRFDSLWSHALQHSRLPCPSPSPRPYVIFHIQLLTLPMLYYRLIHFLFSKRTASSDKGHTYPLYIIWYLI